MSNAAAAPAKAAVKTTVKAVVKSAAKAMADPEAIAHKINAKLGSSKTRDHVAAKIEACEDYGEECREAAEAAGLIYVSDETPGITRKKSGKGWRFISPNGKTITDYWERKRIEKIGVPPAYTDVWICPKENGHIQATGRDDKGRKQYRYHPKWTEARDAAKYAHMAEFGRLLPGIRKRVAADMAKPGYPREKVLATVVSLLEKTLIRVGNEDYVRDNKSFGLTTLRTRHVDVEGATLRFDFKGKSGKMWNLDLKDRRVARVVRSIQELPGQHLFQYIDDDGERRPIDSADVNEYLREITGGADVTAKDFRTWAGTVLASMALSEFEAVDSQALMKKNVKAAIESVSKRLGNTVTICRKCYVHPQVINSYLDGSLLKDIKQEVEAELCEDADQLKPEEAALLGLLSRRISKDVKAGKVA
jgi:DNA topoisomerase I